jgi:hypothetical protein
MGIRKHPPRPCTLPRHEANLPRTPKNVKNEHFCALQIAGFFLILSSRPHDMY